MLSGDTQQSPKKIIFFVGVFEVSESVTLETFTGIYSCYKDNRWKVFCRGHWKSIFGLVEGAVVLGAACCQWLKGRKQLAFQGFGSLNVYLFSLDLVAFFFCEA